MAQHGRPRKDKAPSPLTPPAPLPDGVMVGDRPTNIDFYVRGGRKWHSTVERLKNLPSDRDVQISLEGVPNSKSRITSIRAGVKAAAKELKYEPVIKFALIGNVLHIWSNNV